MWQTSFLKTSASFLLPNLGPNDERSTALADSQTHGGGPVIPHLTHTAPGGLGGDDGSDGSKGVDWEVAGQRV